MRRQTAMLRWNPTTLAALLGALTAVPGAALFTAPKIRLYKNDVDLSEAPVPADFEECDFDGYAAVDLTIDGTARTGDGGRMAYANAEFQAGAALAAPGQAARGYIITNTAFTVVYAGERFDESVGFAAALDLLTLEVFIALRRLQDTGQQQ